MSEHIVIEPSCAACGRPASRIELIPPGELPAQWEAWPESHRQVYPDPTHWRLIFQGITSGTGLGLPISEKEARRIAAAFAQPFSYERIRTAGFFDDAGFCGPCGLPYCEEHWHPSTTGYGGCPRGHGKSLDPHWSPDD